MARILGGFIATSSLVWKPENPSPGCCFLTEKVDPLGRNASFSGWLVNRR